MIYEIKPWILSWVCNSCGAQNPESYNYCGQCGAGK